ncbi:MAG: hypothetical protein Kow0068_20360 [Marinilabiliales bacterium]
MLVVVNCLSQQDSTVFKISPQLDVMSRYIWRGNDYCRSPSIQPSFKIKYKRFSFGAWGAYNKDSLQEADIFIAFDVLPDNKLTITLTDYFFPNENKYLNNYFEYNKSTTTHVYEISGLYKPVKKIPVSFLLATNIYGADARHIDSNGKKGEIMYSTYGEINYTTKFMEYFAGFSFMDPDESIGETGYYGFASGFVNIGVKAKKDIQINENYKIPLSVSLILNPQKENIYIVGGITF